MNCVQLLSAVVSHMNTSERIALANALYESASAEWDRAEKCRLYNQEVGEVFHRGRWREYVDHAKYVDATLPRETRERIGAR